MRIPVLIACTLLSASPLARAATTRSPAVAADSLLTTTLFPANRIVGVWQIQVSLRPCANPAAPPTEFFALNTYAIGGTLSDTNSFPPGMRGPGMGVWRYDRRSRTWISHMTFMRSVDGAFDGVNIANNTLTMLDDDHNTAEVRAQVLNADGSVRAELCGTADGERFDP